MNAGLNLAALAVLSACNAPNEMPDLISAIAEKAGVDPKAEVSTVATKNAIPAVALTALRAEVGLDPAALRYFGSVIDLNGDGLNEAVII